MSLPAAIVKFQGHLEEARSFDSQQMALEGLSLAISAKLQRLKFVQVFEQNPERFRQAKLSQIKRKRRGGRHEKATELYQSYRRERDEIHQGSAAIAQQIAWYTEQFNEQAIAAEQFGHLQLADSYRKIVADLKPLDQATPDIRLDKRVLESIAEICSQIHRFTHNCIDRLKESWPESGAISGSDLAFE